MPKFTVFTPTYNRAHTLPRVYESLRQQSFRSFEWLIVDDGSTDGTAELVARWQKDSSFDIRYYWQENGGKHTATNEALTRARGEWFASIDSDDELTPGALEALDEVWARVAAEDQPEIAGIWGLCVDETGQLVGDPFPDAPRPTSYSEMRHRFRVTGEKWSAHRLDILRRFPYPKADGNYVPEALIYMMIDNRYRSIFVNEPIRVYWSAAPRNDQMSVVWRPTIAARGHALWHGYVLSAQLRWFRFDPIWFFKSMVHYPRFSFHAGDGIVTQFRGVHGVVGKAMWLVGAPVGAMVYLRDRRSSRRTRRN